MTFEKVWEELGVVPECPEDWYPIIIKCHRSLKELDPGYSVAQVKEKWGGLRYYFDMSEPPEDSDVGYDEGLYVKMALVVTLAETEVENLKLNNK